MLTLQDSSELGVSAPMDYGKTVAVFASTLAFVAGAAVVAIVAIRRLKTNRTVDVMITRI